MVLVYIENKPDLFSLSREEALPALESQVLEIFLKLNSLEAVTLGLIIDDSMEIKIQPFSKFVWKIEIITLRNQKRFLSYYSTQKVLRMIDSIFFGIGPDLGDPV
ncbi:MAG: hypothetical protein LBQ84_02880 [Flavobacteriaceae bacterium]|nr:hypothetical protein [Flavobacteriaceae bacterium]